MINAYIIWKDDEEKDFTLEHAWKLLKDQHKWLEQCKEVPLKRINLNEN